jgi:hypothetical protein
MVVQCRQTKLGDAGSSGFVLEYREMECSPLDEAKAFIKANCRVIGEGVKEWAFAALQDVMDDCRHQDASVAATTGIGVGANRADLDESWEAHALTRH